ncbi:lactoylglutathione lyase [Vibrio cholerae]|uniref:VOC family protein n=3 Tax=Vibrio cholerae TaxID=666 RepID=UPI0005B4F312|nr:VOC family protein [Vibrio cholerae]AKB05763.1 glyoxalase/Bleomycin resistance /Dioxygenase superfamily protein [Vibrio cholerae]EGQ8096829.1 lactoylglutathione lyase [Vibrio cholerae]EGQ9204229.1 lactoylglutathione lyase [Vibrio cholerae]EGQ9331114.1 lactoylglutathione lyase [Vibrio cholerae]EGR0659821.1 lactoylglutathione lyase [Vibrio cholerae]
MAKIIHTMIRVMDLERSIKFYQDVLELEIKDQYKFDGFSLTYLSNSNSDFELELTHNNDQRESYSHGSGYGHLAVSVDDIKLTHNRLRTFDFEVSDIKEFYYNQKHSATFFFIKDPDGYKIEFLQRHGRYI